MKEKDEFDYISDYSEFVKTDEQALPPSSVSFRIRDQIKAELQPDLKAVFQKVFVLHTVSGGLTLIFCPQFGIGPLGGGDGLLGFMQGFSHIACGLFCGSIFVTLTTFFSWIFLKKEIQRAIRQSQLTVYSLLGMVSFFALLAFSLMLNGEVPYLHFEFVAPWILAVVFFPILMNQLKYKASFR